MIIRIKYALSLAAAFIILAGCGSIHEFPDGNPADLVPVNLELKFAIDLEMKQYVSKANPANEAKKDTGRYIVEIYEQGSSLPLTRFVAAKQSILNGVNSISAIFPLRATRYTVAAWVDYLDEFGNFYDVADLSAIKISPDYHGSNDSDNAFAGVAEIDLTSYAGQPNAQVVKTIALECPFAKIRVIATDAEKFLMRMKAKGDAKAADLSTLAVNFTYPGFFPTSFNVFQNNPNDVSVGVAFNSNAMLLDEAEFLLGYDYVFVNGNESAVLLSLKVYNSNNDEINSISEISIPIARGKITTIRGDLLTGNYEPGITIDTGYAGEINIELD